MRTPHRVPETMKKKFKYRKIFIAMFLTILIWVFADRAQDEEFTISGAMLHVSKSTPQNLWVSFEVDEQHRPSIPIKNIVLKGSASNIAEVRRDRNEGSFNTEFFFDPEKEGITSARSYEQKVIDILRQSKEFSRYGVLIVSCQPETVTISVVQLEEKMLNVQCVTAEDQSVVDKATIEPPQVNISVPENWTSPAIVQLKRTEITQAMSSPIIKKPYVKLAPEQFSYANSTVNITMPAEEDPRRDYTITSPKFGYTLSPNLQGKFTVEVTNLDNVMSPVNIKATPEAKRAYQSMRYQLLLEIDDSDKNTGPEEILKRELTYNFPSEYLRSEEIKLNQQPVEARFKLLPVEKNGTTPP